MHDALSNAFSFPQRRLWGRGQLVEDRKACISMLPFDQTERHRSSPTNAEAIRFLETPILLCHVRRATSTSHDIRGFAPDGYISLLTLLPNCNSRQRIQTRPTMRQRCLLLPVRRKSWSSHLSFGIYRDIRPNRPSFGGRIIRFMRPSRT